MVRVARFTHHKRRNQQKCFRGGWSKLPDSPISQGCFWRVAQFTHLLGSAALLGGEWSEYSEGRGGVVSFWGGGPSIRGPCRGVQQLDSFGLLARLAPKRRPSAAWRAPAAGAPRPWPRHLARCMAGARSLVSLLCPGLSVF